jgi:uncharacterized protein (TIGR04222 family)
MMNESQLKLYQRIQAFSLDDDTHALSFSQLLARSNRWQIEYAKRAMEEYKKFAFLAVVAGHPVSPSDQVDQVWHLHILHSHSYWDDFCPHVLQHPFHHRPAQGGREERETLHHYYRMTLDSYYRFFGQPPEDIWPTPWRRFGKDMHMQRINTTEFWVVPKQLPKIRAPRLTRGIGVLLVSLAIVGCSNATQALSWGGEDSSIAYFKICGLALLGAYLLRWLLRASWTEPVKPQLDDYEIAYLAGGKNRAVDLAITNLVKQRYLNPEPKYRSFSVLKVLPETSYPLELHVMAQINQNPNLFSIRQAVAPKTTFIRDRLQKEGLLMKGKAAEVCHIFPVFIVLGAVMLGYFRITSDALHASSYTNVMGYLLVLGFPLVFPPYRSQWGDLFLKQLQSLYSTNIAYRFALSGSIVLSGGVLDDLKQVFDPPSSNADGGCAAGGC